MHRESGECLCDGRQYGNWTICKPNAFIRSNWSILYDATHFKLTRIVASAYSKRNFMIANVTWERKLYGAIHLNQTNWYDDNTTTTRLLHRYTYPYHINSDQCVSMRLSAFSRICLPHVFRSTAYLGQSVCACSCTAHLKWNNRSGERHRARQPYDERTAQENEEVNKSTSIDGTTLAHLTNTHTRTSLKMLRLV